MLDNFYKTQMDVVIAIKHAICNWECGLIDDKELETKIKKIISVNKEIIYRNGKLGSIIEQRLGKKRLRIIKKLLERK